MQAVASMRIFRIWLLGFFITSCAWITGASFSEKNQIYTSTTTTLFDNGTYAPIEDSSDAKLIEPRLVATLPSGGKIFILQPPEDAVVDTQWVDVRGSAPPGTVISLDDEVVLAGEDGAFSARVPLASGPNEIQGVASDAEGGEAYFSLIVVFESASS